MKTEKVVAFAREQGYDNVKQLAPWKGFEVYEPVFDGDELALVGLPLLILVKDNKIRMSTPDEAFKHIEETE